MGGIKILEDLGVRPAQAQGYVTLGQLYADTAQKAKARRTLKKAKTMFQEMGMDYFLGRTEKALEKVEK